MSVKQEFGVQKKRAWGVYTGIERKIKNEDRKCQFRLHYTNVKVENKNTGNLSNTVELYQRLKNM